ncbi:hypothetical protein RGAI101_1054 [Roseobacter sp. GAI101]|nr:hypothetical protein RGAI101_1054 [Roseobacter sp. GAI101]
MRDAQNFRKFRSVLFEENGPSRNFRISIAAARRPAMGAPMVCNFHEHLSKG